MINTNMSPKYNVILAVGCIKWLIYENWKNKWSHMKLLKPSWNMKRFERRRNITFKEGRQWLMEHKGNILSRKTDVECHHPTAPAHCPPPLCSQSWRTHRDCFLRWRRATFITLRQPWLTEEEEEEESWRNRKETNREKSLTSSLSIVLTFLWCIWIPHSQNEKKRKKNTTSEGTKKRTTLLA